MLKSSPDQDRDALIDALSRTSLEAKLVHRAYRPLFANPACADMFQFEDAADILAQSSVLALFDADTRANPDSAWRAAIANAGAMFGRRTFTRRSGASFRVELIARRVLWAGEPAIALAILDVSEEERAARALAAARADVEEAALQQRALLTASARILQGPLHSLRASLAPIAESADETGEISRAALGACEDLLRRALQIADLQHDEAVMSFDVDEAMRETLTAARCALPNLNIEIANISARHALGKPGRLKRAVRGLLDVAAERARGAPIRLSAGYEERGFTLQIETTAAGDLAGGPARLHMARALFESLGGALLTRSGPGARWSAHARAPLSAAHTLRPVAASPRDILVVDDNPGARRILNAMLLMLGHRPTAAANGAAALAALSAQRFDLVLLDVNMPGMDGLETARRIRALPRPWAGLPIAAVTASTSAEVRDAVAEAGMDAFLVKPVEVARLADQIVLLTGAPLMQQALIEPAKLEEIQHENHPDEAEDQKRSGPTGHESPHQEITSNPALT